MVAMELLLLLLLPPRPASLLLLTCLHLHLSLSSLLDDDATHLHAFLQYTLPPPATYNFSASPCNWNGVSCFNDSNQTRIGRLLLEGLQLTGSIPAGTLGRLQALTHLSLYNNSLTGSVPLDVWNMSSLVYLSLSRNKLVGRLPPQVAILGNVVRLDLSHNGFSGSIPFQFGELTNLRFLFLRSNAFNSSVPIQLSNCSSLLELDISSNELTGTIPAWLSSMENLVVLNLSRNAFSGELLLNFSYMPHLFVLDLSANSLNGSLLHVDGLNMLEVLIVSCNKLSGPLPTILNKRLRVLDLSGNSFSGEISPQMWSFSFLTFLDVSFNNLTGTLPENFSSLASLRYLSLAKNDFTVSSFPSLYELRQLEYLDLSSLHLVGSIPESIGSLTNLTVLKLSRNHLTGRIPVSIINLQYLTVLDLRDNYLSGNMSFLMGLPRLIVLNLSNNNLPGCFPPALLTKFGAQSFAGNGRCQPLAANITANNVKTSRSFNVRLAVLVGIIVGSTFILIAILAALIYWMKERRFSGRASFNRVDKYVSGPFSFETDSGTWVATVKDPSSIPVVIFDKPLLNLTFADLLQITSNFNKESQLTEGGFGPVYRARLSGDLHVTIKVLIEGRILTDHEAASEFGVLSRIKHPNIVPLLGYCLVGDERLVIYKYVENGGLHRWLHDWSTHNQEDDWSRETWKPGEETALCFGEVMNWTRRHRIGLGIARALAFLHHGFSSQLVHRDVKANNVMLDADFEPHLANTGLAGLLAASDDILCSGGTPGYVPPEYCQLSAKATIKGDVYSFGVVLLELVTGKKPVGDFYQEEFVGNLVGWVRLLTKEKKGYRALDPRVINRGPLTEMLGTLRIGYLCTQVAPEKRPTMQQVVGLLKDIEAVGDSPSR